jgi:valyl-tRNA synthetase
MGGNVESYYDDLEDQRNEQSRQYVVLASAGLESIKGDTILVVSHKDGRGRYEYLIGRNKKPIMQTLLPIELSDVVKLLRDLGHNVRVVKIDE